MAALAHAAVGFAAKRVAPSTPLWVLLVAVYVVVPPICADEAMLASAGEVYVRLPLMVASGPTMSFPYLPRTLPLTVRRLNSRPPAPMVPADPVAAFLVVRWVLRFVQTHTFVGFGWYRIALGALILALSLA